MTREEAKKQLMVEKRFAYRPEKWEALEMAIQELSKPAIVHCKDCKYWEPLISNRGHCISFGECHDEELYTYSEWFCADGELEEEKGE